MKLKSPVVLLILDGWGLAPAWGANAISQGDTPNFDKLWKNYPHTQLEASGEYVGLPGHEQGNSEVGHLNIGSGRVVDQDSSKISESIKNQTFFSNQELIKAIERAKENKSNLHLMGLLSTGLIHAHVDHLYALLELAKKHKFDKVYIDLFTDGRDTMNMSAIEMISKLQQKIKKIGVGQINLLIGRYYAMDRDNRWSRTELAYNLLVKGKGTSYESPLSAISGSYKHGMTDEYLKPVLIDSKTANFQPIKDNDSIIFFNFRSDRARQMTRAFMQDKFHSFKRKKLKNLYFVSLIPYGVEKEIGAKNVHSAFAPAELKNTLAEILSENEFNQLHIAETEKYAHITYFFNGGKEKKFQGEERIIIPSPNVATYDLKPSMSVDKITKKIISKLNFHKCDFVVANFANTDMVGHTGNYKAALEAVECVDKSIGLLYNAIAKLKGIFIITADHGNADEMINPKTGKKSTQHSRNPVPFILIDTGPTKYKLKDKGVLADIAPTILEVININKPKEMTGSSLIDHNNEKENK